MTLVINAHLVEIFTSIYELSNNIPVPNLAGTLLFPREELSSNIVDDQYALALMSMGNFARCECDLVAL